MHFVSIVLLFCRKNWKRSGGKHDILFFSCFSQDDLTPQQYLLSLQRYLLFPQQYLLSLQRYLLFPQQYLQSLQRYLLFPQQYLLSLQRYLLFPQHYLLSMQHYLLSPQHYLLSPQHYLLSSQRYLLFSQHYLHYHGISISISRGGTACVKCVRLTAGRLASKPPILRG